MPQTIDGDILTTFQAAKLCGVSHKSIERWIDSGLLRGFRTPGGHRRLNRSDLLEFVANRRTDGNGAAPLERMGPTRVLIVGDEPVADPTITSQFDSTDRFAIESASSCFEAGILVERYRPQVLVIDLEMDSLDGAAIWHHIRNDATHSGVLVIAVTESAEAARHASGSGMYHATMLRPLPPSSLRLAIDSLLENAGFVRKAIAGS